MTTSQYSSFFTSGLHAPAASVYTYNHPVLDFDEDVVDPQVTPPADFALYHNISLNTSTSRYAQNQNTRPFVRKRRSSITASASPVSAMKLAKSPARAAGNAWHMANVAAGSPSRSRSGSLHVASEDTSMFGRMRSGSVGSNLRPRRKPVTSRPLLFAPMLPPPTAPLPALPLCAPAPAGQRPPLHRLATQPVLPVADVFYASPVSPVPSSPSAECYHAPGVWMGFGDNGRIDEEMKEN
ncbi:hypothetical protein B0H10DRAFT_2212277 [Mycena sp. CBHHK59/15]|nr:hypothetical protein B0H10DRAFT_2212277 [Mycena sp. CBHHK59/15]